MSEAKKSELALRDKAILHQQRRLKQVTQFTHKDSADLLPLDGLKRLGTSKDLQPHSIVQRRLIEGNIPRLRGEARDAPYRMRSPLADNKDGPEAEEKSESTADDSTEEKESPEESEKSLRSEEDEEEDSSEGRETAGARPSKQTDRKGKTEEETERERTEGSSFALTALLVQCKCGDTDVTASINTGSPHNRITSACCRSLGLSPSLQPVGERQPDSAPMCSTVSDVLLQLGTERIHCSAYVVEEGGVDLCLGLQTLLELKCSVDLSRRLLKLQGSGEELPFLPRPDESRLHDSNKNL